MMNAKGIGGSTAQEELGAINPIKNFVAPIPKTAYQERMQKATVLMQEQGLGALYLHAGTNLYYFTGMRWGASERMVGALLLPNGELHYIAPKFEEGTIRDFMQVAGRVHCWEEHESPYALFLAILSENGFSKAKIGIDESTPFFISNGIQLLDPTIALTNAKAITAGCRMVKSAHEIAIIQQAMDITLAVQQAAARILRPGITAKEVVNFIDAAHKKYGIPTGSYFCIVLFGKDTSFPHGVANPNPLKENDNVIIDTGCMLHSYISDITRSYVFGTPSLEQTRIWKIEKEAQQAAFDAAQLGQPCAAVDKAARKTLVAHGLGPDYQLPGLPHRTGHGIGLDIHEWPYMVRNDQTILEAGMTFSNEPMIVVPDQFGVRLEDHIYMTKDGPKWFTPPMHSIDNPFGL